MQSSGRTEDVYYSIKTLQRCIPMTVNLQNTSKAVVFDACQEQLKPTPVFLSLQKNLRNLPPGLPNDSV